MTDKTINTTSLKRHKKIGKIYNPDTMLVFDNNTVNRKVIGRIENDFFIDFDQQSFELCEKYNLNYDKSLVEEDEPDYEEEENKKDILDDTSSSKKDILDDTSSSKKDILDDTSSSKKDILDDSNFDYAINIIKQVLYENKQKISELQKEIDKNKKKMNLLLTAIQEN